MQNLINEFGVPKQYSDTLVGLLQKHFPRANIPLSKPDPESNTVKSLTDMYNVQHRPYTSFHVPTPKNHVLLS
jgi:hypothetical protein